MQLIFTIRPCIKTSSNMDVSVRSTSQQFNAVPSHESCSFYLLLFPTGFGPLFLFMSVQQPKRKMRARLSFLRVRSNLSSNLRLSITARQPRDWQNVGKDRGNSRARRIILTAAAKCTPTVGLCDRGAYQNQYSPRNPRKKGNVLFDGFPLKTYELARSGRVKKLKGFWIVHLFPIVLLKRKRLLWCGAFRLMCLSSAIAQLISCTAS
jgi:hypothetical protein